MRAWRKLGHSSLLVPGVTSLFAHQSGEGGGTGSCAQLGSCWSPHVLRAGAVLTSVPAIFASSVIQGSHYLLVSLPLVQPGCNPVSDTKVSVFLGEVRKFKVLGLQLCENRGEDECVR